ncbi:hypothetical protein PV350_04775 [Streptomyces sp. PA03-6a]|nr:hypothetical protein [Streptomyces sp. PA03-6a]
MIHTDRLDHITAHGMGRLPRKIRLTDDTVISVHAGPGAYSTPRPMSHGLGNAPEDYAGPYTHLEVYLMEPGTAPDTWAEFTADGEAPAERRLYGYVPQELVYGLVVAHGGEHIQQDTGDDLMKALTEGMVDDVLRGK